MTQTNMKTYAVRAVRRTAGADIAGGGAAGAGDAYASGASGTAMEWLVRSRVHGRRIAHRCCAGCAGKCAGNVGIWHCEARSMAGAWHAFALPLHPLFVLVVCSAPSLDLAWQGPCLVPLTESSAEFEQVKNYFHAGGFKPTIVRIDRVQVWGRADTHVAHSARSTDSKRVQRSHPAYLPHCARALRLFPAWVACPLCCQRPRSRCAARASNPERSSATPFQL
jgi:hypothetical protein